MTAAPFRYLSVCSGVEAATVAWHSLDWEPAAFSEIEAFPLAVLAHHYPNVPRHGDFTTIGADEYGSTDLLVGGTPCQDYSVAGLRAGLDGDRGNLTLEFGRLAYRSRSRWLLWENVPGVFSLNQGRDFGAILATFSGRHGSIFEPPEGGWRNSGIVEPADDKSFGLAWRVLDAQHFGVPQRRRRVFIVGYIGDWRRAAAVLFERHSLSGHPAPRRQTGEGITASPGGIAGTCSSKWAKGSGGPADDEHYNLIAHSLRGEGFDASEDGTGRGTPLVPVAYQTSGNCGAWETGAITGALDTNTDPNSHVVCFTAKDHGADASDISPTLRSGSHSGSHANGGVMPAVAFDRYNQTASDINGTLDQQANWMALHKSAVRRLTPRECERLQGFPDDYTLVPYRGKPAADGPRYKAVGNSMAVPCMLWIGQRIQMVEDLCRRLEDAA
jgi:DNA (cytosine-5)-methyltransferase 1